MAAYGGQYRKNWQEYANVIKSLTADERARLLADEDRSSGLNRKSRRALRFGHVRDGAVAKQGRVRG